MVTKAGSKESLNEDLGLGGREPTTGERDAAATAETDARAKNTAAAQRVTGEAEPAPPSRPVASPIETEAQAAAGPHRPEPATPIHHGPTGSAAVPRAAPKGVTFLRVRATQDGFVGDARRRAGSVFDVPEADFSEKWMERVPAATAATHKSAQDRINEEHDAINAGKVSGKKATGNRKVLGDDD